MLSSQKLMAFVATRDAKRAKSFYEDVLGLHFVRDDSFAMVFDSNGTTIRIARVAEWTPPPFTVLGWEVSDIQAAASGLTSRGVVFEGFGMFAQDVLGIWDAPDGARVAWFKDPDGNVLSISQHPV